MKNKYIKLLTSISAALVILLMHAGCEKDETTVSAVLSGGADVLAGDSTELTVQFEGTPPFALRYSTENVSGKTNNVNILGIENHTYTFKVAPGDTTIYKAESAAVKYGNVGTAQGTATINVIPVNYILDQTFTCSNSGYVYQADGNFYEQDVKKELELRQNSGGWDRAVYFEFDTKEITTVEEKNKYTLKFEIVNNHWSAGFGKGPELMEVKGMIGELNPALTWGTQPGEGEWTHLFNQAFETPGRYDLTAFSGDISGLVRSAVNSSQSKITIRAKENINGIGSGAFHFIASGTYEDESKRPSIEVRLRRAVE